MLTPRSDDDEAAPAEPPAPRSILSRVAIGVGAALLAWLVLPAVPRDHTVEFELGKNAASVARLDVHWETEDGSHEGNLALNFPAPTPERVVRQFRMTDGDYAFRITAVHRDATQGRTEVVRRVRLDGNNITLRLDELSP